MASAASATPKQVQRVKVSKAKEDAAIPSCPLAKYRLGKCSDRATLSFTITSLRPKNQTRVTCAVSPWILG